MGGGRWQAVSSPVGRRHARRGGHSWTRCVVRAVAKRVSASAETEKEKEGPIVPAIEQAIEPRTVDYAAVSRVAGRVDLVQIRLADIGGRSHPRPRGTLEAAVAYRSRLVDADSSIVNVDSQYRFTATIGDTEIAEAKFTFRLVYEVEGEEPIDRGDLEQFAFANGIYHSWPFARQAIFDLTARMGLPPYTLPVMVFTPTRSRKTSPDSVAEGDRGRQ